jgi:hypothetical protein
LPLLYKSLSFKQPRSLSLSQAFSKYSAALEKFCLAPLPSSYEVPAKMQPSVFPNSQAVLKNLSALL